MLSNIVQGVDVAGGELLANDGDGDSNRDSVASTDLSAFLAASVEVDTNAS